MECRLEPLMTGEVHGALSCNAQGHVNLMILLNPFSFFLSDVIFILSTSMDDDPPLQVILRLALTIIKHG